jgi:membrane fusion protein (multidrug efflux system)
MNGFSMMSQWIGSARRGVPGVAWLSLVAVACSLAACKKQAGAAGGPPSFAAQALVVEARNQPVTEALSLVGSIVANEIVELKSETEGTVQEILFAEGQPVKEGELLMRLDESKFAAAAAEAEANFKVSEANYERAKKLYGDNLVSKQEIDQTAAAFQAGRAAFDLKKRQLRDARIVAPFGGVASARRVSPGQVIDKNTLLTVLVDLNPVKVELSVPERFVGQLKVGQKLTVKIAAFPERQFVGEVYFVAPYLNEVDRTALLKARIPNPDFVLKPGMFANVDLTLQVKPSAIVVPESSILYSGDRTVVYVVDNQDTAQIRPVKLGTRLAGQVEIVQGLKAGERVVSEGLQKVRPGGKVKAVAPEAPVAPAMPGMGTNATNAVKL